MTKNNDLLLTKQRIEKKEILQKQEADHYRRSIEIEIATDLEDAEYRIKDAYWCEKIGMEFVRHYPGHGWEVHVDIRNGIANVFNRHMSALHGYRMKTKDIILMTLSRDVKRIGGEILERFGLSRSRFDADHVLDIQRRTMGRAKADGL